MHVRNALASAVMLVTLTGCGGGGGGSDSSSKTVDPQQNTTLSVTAIDGYLRNAKVWLDTDNNYRHDKGEPSGETGEGGKVDLDVTGINNPEQFSVVVQAIPDKTIDESTITTESPEGKKVSTGYVMSAPAGETDVTPLSTLVDIKLRVLKKQPENADESLEDITQKAKEAVSEEIGIPEDKLLGDFIESGDTQVAEKAEWLVELYVIPENYSEFSDPAPVDSDVIDKIKDVYDNLPDDGVGVFQQC